jgi:hypothetical protein
MDEQKILLYDPFADDFGNYGDKILKDKLVKARKENTCFICGETIHKGDTIRSITTIYEGEIGTARYCTKCCEAMEVWDEDDTELTERYNIPYKKKGNQN